MGADEHLPINGFTVGRRRSDGWCTGMCVWPEKVWRWIIIDSSIIWWTSEFVPDLTTGFYQTDILKDVPFEGTDDIQKTAKNIIDVLYRNEALELESYDVIAWDSDNGLVFVMMKSYGMISSVISWMSLDCIQPQELIFGYTKTGGVEKLIVKNSFPYRHSVERHC